MCQICIMLVSSPFLLMSSLPIISQTKLFSRFYLTYGCLLCHFTLPMVDYFVILPYLWLFTLSFYLTYGCLLCHFTLPTVVYFVILPYLRLFTLSFYLTYGCLLCHFTLPTVVYVVMFTMVQGNVFETWENIISQQAIYAMLSGNYALLSLSYVVLTQMYNHGCTVEPLF